MRRCTRCGRTRETDLFRWQPSVGAYHSWCRDCEREHRRTRTRRPATRRTTQQQGRAFGVELELTGPDPQTIMNALTSAGVSVRNVGTYRASNGAQWELKHDGSVSGYGLELVSPKLRGEAGFNELRTVLHALQSVGATVNRTTGTHVHIDFRNVDFASVRRQVNFMVANQDNMLRMVAPSRRGNVYNPSWSEQSIREFNSTYTTLQTMRSPRGTVNLGAYTRHGSIEFRSHGGTTNYAKLSAWIRFLFAALKYGDENPTATTPARQFNSPGEMLTALNMSLADREQLLRFERAAELLEEAEYAEVTV